MALLASILFCLSQNLYSQTKGLIVEPAGTPALRAVLDPNGDGYISATTAGFMGDDKANSEIPYKTLIPAGIEPDSDVRNGPDCGYSDFVESVDGGIDPAFHYSTGTHWLFRLRMADIKPNAKSYSILIDIDGIIGPTSAAYTAGVNPGFEVEIVLATKFGVRIYDHRIGCGGSLVHSYDEKRYQKAIAASSVGCSGVSINYFLDFYVDWADLTSIFGITENTPMRYAIVDNMAADKSTICNQSSASDIGGVDDTACGSLFDCFSEVINNQPVCPPDNDTPCVFSDCPAITSSVSAGVTTISGTSTEPVGTTIRIYIQDDASSPYTTTVQMGGTWTQDVTELVEGKSVNVTAENMVDGEVESGSNCSNIQTVGSAQCSADILTLTRCAIEKIK
jgi:hypothetical protein